MFMESLININSENNKLKNVLNGVADRQFRYTDLYLYIKLLN